MTAIAGCDVSAGVVSKTSGPRGVEHPDGPGDHYASHRLLSTVAPWRQSRSLGSPCGVGCQSPSLALALSLSDLQLYPLWSSFLGSSVLKDWSLTVSLSPRGEGEEGVNLKISRCHPTFSFLGWSSSWCQDDVYLDLVGSLDSVAEASESEPRIVSAQEKVDENEEKRDTAATDPLNTYLQVGFFQHKTTTEPSRLETGLPSGTLLMRRGISTTPTQEPYLEPIPKSKV